MLYNYDLMYATILFFDMNEFLLLFYIEIKLNLLSFFKLFF